MRSDPDILTVEQAAALLRLKPPMVRWLAARSLLPSGRTGARFNYTWRFSKRQLVAFIETVEGPYQMRAVHRNAHASSSGTESAGRPDILDVEEAAELLQLSAPTVRQMADRKLLPGRQLGKLWRFSRRQLIEFIEAGGEGLDVRAVPAAARQQVTMLSSKGIPDAELALGLVMDALRREVKGPVCPPEAPPQPAKPDSMQSIRERRAARTNRKERPLRPARS